MQNTSDDLRDALVSTLLDVIKENGTETPASILNVARQYVRDNPPEESLPLAGSKSGVLKEFLDVIPFPDQKNN